MEHNSFVKFSEVLPEVATGGNGFVHFHDGFPQKFPEGFVKVAQLPNPTHQGSTDVGGYFELGSRLEKREK